MAYDNKSTADEGDEPAEPEQDEGEDTFLVSKSALYNKDIEVGDKETIEAVSILDGEVEFKCVGKKEKSETPDMDAANSQLDGMVAPAEA